MSTVLERTEPTEEATPGTSARPPRALGYLALALLAYVPPLLTDRGKVAADTKQYLYLDPGRLISRAVSMWDPNIGMGTVTHQTIGYAFPMGPYYWLLDKLGVPDWVAQRLWLGSLLFFAGLGMLYLMRTFAIRGPGVVVAALAYMLTPYVLDYSARISVLLMPWAALPWMVGVIRKALRVESATAGEQGRGWHVRLARWRYPAIFALIVQIVGGVNATALLFAGLAPVLWLVHSWLFAREVRFRTAFAVALRTGIVTLLTSLWWIAGLRMQAAYGLDILKYTETVDAVARTSTPNEVLRGLGYWFFYGQDRLGPWTQASLVYTQQLPVILAGYLLAALSLFALAYSKWKHRAYLVVLLLVGVVIAVGAHPYNSPTPLGALFKALSASSTAALAMRSTGRVVPVVVLALAIALGLAVNFVSGRARRMRYGTIAALTAPAIVVVLLLVNFPALHNGTYYGKNLERPEQIPQYWQAAIAALGNDQSTRVLEAPGSDFASYRWGNTVDPITPGLTDRPYVARELIPYGTAGTADLLNALDRRLQEGIADPNGIVPLLRRMGVGDVLARNDIQYERYDLVPPRELARVLARTPGLGTPQNFGTAADLQPSGFQNEISLAAPANEPALAPVVLYPVNDPATIVRAESPDHALMVSGDGEGLVDAADVGLLDGAGVIRYSASYSTPAALRDATNAGSVLVVTDNNRLRARRWTSVKDNVGFTEQAGEADKPTDTDNGDARLPLFPAEQASAYTTTTDVGVARVLASSYGNTITYTPEERPAMALDGDPFTAWRAATFGDPRGQSLRIDLDGPITTDHVNIEQPISGPRARWITEAELRFDGKDAMPVILNQSSRTIYGQDIKFPRRTFHRLDITVKKINDERPVVFASKDGVGIAEVRLRDEHATQDVQLHEVEQMPTDLTQALGAATADHPIVFVMRRDAVRPVPPRSQPELSIARAFTLPTERTFSFTGNASIAENATPEVLQQTFGIPDASQFGVSTSSSEYLYGCLPCQADSAIDGDPNTAYQTPFVGVRNQWVQYTSFAPLSFDHMDMQVIADGRHSVPTKIQLDVDGQTRELSLPPISDGGKENATAPVHLTFPPVTGHTVKVTITDVREERSKQFQTSATSLMPAGIAELGIPGLVLPPAPAQLDSGCRNDLVAVDGRPFPVRVSGPTASAARVDEVMGLTVTPCDPANPGRVPTLTLPAGHHVITTARGKDAGWSLDRMVLASGTPDATVATDAGHVTQVGAPAPAGPRIDVVHNGRTSIRVHVTGATQPFWMVLGQSRSPGWHASVVGGRDLGASQLVDGYANGWLVKPTRDGFDIAMNWTPQRQVWASIWISLLVALGALVLIGLTWRSRLAGAQTAYAGDNDIAIGVLDVPGPNARRGSIRFVAPLVAGLIAGVAAAPWIGVLVAALVAAMIWKPRVRPVLLFAPAAILALCGAYIVVQQWQHAYPAVFEWPTFFPRARTPAWIAVLLLVADLVYLLVCARASTRADGAGVAADDESTNESD